MKVKKQSIKENLSLKEKLEQILQKYFGFAHFRSGQLEVIFPLIKKRDVLAILPTGGGKSLCFQIPGLYLGGTTLVISPLISLMQDQVQNLEKHGVAVTFINSTLSREEQEKRLAKFLAGQYQFVYVSPEKLASQKFRQICQQVNLSLIAIDEAHCISVWGHDFRPNYLQIGTFIDQLKKRPVIAAFTATANKRAQQDIVSFCHLKNYLHQQKSFARDNLQIYVYRCFNEHDKLLRLLSLLQKHAGETGIIYVLTRKDAVSFAQLLNRLRPQQESIQIYHGGLDKDLRSQIQADFISGKQKIIIATNAFGMGVDQPHVRFVIHAQISSNLENYFQEIGRAGRDDASASCYTLYLQKDLQISADFVNRNHSADKKQLQILQFKLEQMIKYLQTKKCRQNFILNYFDEKTNFCCGLCDHCRQEKLHYNRLTQQKFAQFQSWRRRYARAHQLVPSSIVTDLALAYLAILDFKSLPDLTLIPGIGTGAKKILINLFLTSYNQKPKISNINCQKN